jgi:hypothetical protein
MNAFWLCYSDESTVYEATTAPFYDLLSADGEWIAGIVNTTDRAEAQRLLGIPDDVELEPIDERAPWPYTHVWRFAMIPNQQKAENR